MVELGFELRYGIPESLLLQRNICSKHEGVDTFANGARHRVSLP
jgi:hypothetical protein